MQEPGGLNEQVAIVTGASRGLGRAIAEELSRRGCRVLGVARTKSALVELAESSANIRYSVCDIADCDKVAALSDLAVGEFGRLDILVNNAAIGSRSAFLDLSFSEWDSVLAVNVRAPAVLSQACGRVFVSQGHGKIVNIASIAGLCGVANMEAYCASKGALIQLTRSLAVEWASRNVQVNAVAPGSFDTYPDRGAKDRALSLEKIPSSRMGRSVEIAPLVCYLVSKEANFITGSVITIDGGETAGL